MNAVLMVEDDPIVGASLRTELEAEGYTARWARGLEEGWRLFQEQEPSLVLLDLTLPDGSGLELLRRVRERSRVPVIAVTGLSLSADKVRGLDLGADDYVTKPFWTEELLARMRALLRRAPSAPRRAVVRMGEATVDLEAHRLEVRDRTVTLTVSEHALLRVLAARPGAAIRREELLGALGAEGTEASLQTHMSRLRAKLGPEAGRLTAVWGIGYRLEVDPDET